jgi:hypothetical protein
MLVWLASYPRSGNTLLRAVLKECLGLSTFSLHDDGDRRVFATPSLCEAVGHEARVGTNEALLDSALSSPSPVVVKTHEPPLLDAKTIRVVRNGQSALVSYYHFLNDVEHVPATMESVIRGQVYAGSWSNHHRAWRDMSSTTLVRYERLVEAPDVVAFELADFLGLRVTRRFSRSFAELQSLHPKFFRRGSDSANVAEMAPHKPLFDENHADVMRELGYGLG